MNSIVLPPLDCAEVRASSGERMLNALVVAGLHLLLLYAAFYLSVKNDLIELPASISVRLLPMIEEKKVVVPSLPLTPVNRPQAKSEKPVAPPVLAVTAATPSAMFAVQVQPVIVPVQPVAAAPTVPVAVIAARFDAEYLHNPKPVYPSPSRRIGEEGKVLLKVRVSAQGAALDVSISKSSGYERLDQAASDAVTRWRFVPARRGDDAIESSVIVPITFALD